MIPHGNRRQFLQHSAGMAAAGAAAAVFGLRAWAEEESDGFPWKAGVARAVITPEKAVWLAGYGSKRSPDGILHDLWMKALALEDPEGRRVVLITSDFQGVPKGMSDGVFAQIKERYGLEREQVMFTFSHNHCGPRLGDDLVDYYPIEDEQVELVAEYTALMQDRAVALVGEALAGLAPAALQQGEGKATFAVNRRTPATPPRSVSSPGAATFPASRSWNWRTPIPARRRCSSTPAAATRTRFPAAPWSFASATATCWRWAWKRRSPGR